MSCYQKAWNSYHEYDIETTLNINIDTFTWKTQLAWVKPHFYIHFTLSKKWNIPLSIILFTQSIALNSKIFVELLGIYPWNLNLLVIYRLGIV